MSSLIELDKKISITSPTKDDIDGIILLRDANFRTKKTPGVGWKLTKEQLLKYMDYERSVVLKRVEEVLGYILTIDRTIINEEGEKKLPEGLEYMGRSIDDFRVALGQVCVSEKVRGQGFFQKMYDIVFETCQRVYDLRIMVVRAENEVSLRAHNKLPGVEVLIKDGDEKYFLVKDFTTTTDILFIVTPENFKTEIFKNNEDTDFLLIR